MIKSYFILEKIYAVNYNKNNFKSYSILALIISYHYLRQNSGLILSIFKSKIEKLTAIIFVFN